MKKARLRTNSVEETSSGFINRSLLTPCRRVGLVAPRKSLQQPLKTVEPPPVKTEPPPIITKPIPSKIESPPSVQKAPISKMDALLAVIESPDAFIMSETVQLSRPPSPNVIPPKIEIPTVQPLVVVNPIQPNSKSEIETPPKRGRAKKVPIYKEANLEHSDEEPLSTIKNKTKGKKSTAKNKENKRAGQKRKRSPQPPQSSKITSSQTFGLDSDEEFLPQPPRKSKSSNELLNLDPNPNTANEIEELKKCIKIKKEKLSCLTLNTLSTESIKTSILQWRKGCQQALEMLLALQKKQNDTITMEQLLQSLNIPCELVQYDAEQMFFIE